LLFADRQGSMRTDSHTEAERLLSIPEVAVKLNLSISSVRRLIAQGDIPAVKLGRAPNSSVRVYPSELACWLDSGEAA
jgi:excisionase family DNA binding protein